MATEEELKENCSVFESEIKTKPINKIKSFEIPATETLCSGCNYCSPCSVGIPILDLMQGYNHKILLDSSETQMEEQRKIKGLSGNTDINVIDLHNDNDINWFDMFES